MAEEVTLPASTAYKLAQSAADSRKQEVEAERTLNAEDLSEAQFELFEASLQAKGGQLVAVDAFLTATAVAFCDDGSVRNTGAAFLENIGYW